MGSGAFDWFTQVSHNWLILSFLANKRRKMLGGQQRGSAHPLDVAENEDEEDPEEDRYDSCANEDNDFHTGLVVRACRRKRAH